MNGKHVLIVEDDCLENLALCEFLQDRGYRTEPAYCAPAALAAIRRRPPWALITDLDLGDGPGGFEVARYARALDAAMPVIYIAGEVCERFPRDAVDGSRFVAKPYRRDQILAALQGGDPPKAAGLRLVEPSRTLFTWPVADAAGWGPHVSHGNRAVTLQGRATRMDRDAA